MATLIQGFGTTFLGQRDFLPDGSHITTEWVVVFFIPIVPLRSLRVKPAKPINQNSRATDAPVFWTDQNGPRAPLGLSWAEHYATHPLPQLNVKQLLSVYGFTIGYIAYVSASVWLLFAWLNKIFARDRYALMAFAVLILIPWLLPYLLRSRAKGRS
jgi:hypothetical protein